jgi:hypothetical protein
MDVKVVLRIAQSNEKSTLPLSVIIKDDFNKHKRAMLSKVCTTLSAKFVWRIFTRKFDF